jgi:hypothetical protein
MHMRVWPAGGAGLLFVTTGGYNLIRCEDTKTITMNVTR